MIDRLWIDPRVRDFDDDTFDVSSMFREQVTELDSKLLHSGRHRLPLHVSSQCPVDLNPSIFERAQFLERFEREVRCSRSLHVSNDQQFAILGKKYPIKPVPTIVFEFTNVLMSKVSFEVLTAHCLTRITHLHTIAGIDRIVSDDIFNAGNSLRPRSPHHIANGLACNVRLVIGEPWFVLCKTISTFLGPHNHALRIMCPHAEAPLVASDEVGVVVVSL